MQKKITVCRKEHFNAAHRLHNEAWPAEKNQAVFGKCNNANYHGHNYELIVQLTGEINPETGYVIDLKNLSDVIQQQVLDRFDHKNLNLDTQEFKALNPSVENMAIVIYDLLKAKLPQNLDIRITLYETERNFVIYPSI